MPARLDEKKYNVTYVPEFKQDIYPLIKKAITYAHRNNIDDTSYGRYSSSIELNVGAGCTNNGLLYYDVAIYKKEHSKPVNFRIVQQSKEGTSDWSILARQGAKIWQVMLKIKNGSNRHEKFGMLIHGDFYQFDGKRMKKLAKADREAKKKKKQLTNQKEIY